MVHALQGDRPWRLHGLAHGHAAASALLHYPLIYPAENPAIQVHLLFPDKTIALTQNVTVKGDDSGKMGSFTPTSQVLLTGFPLTRCRCIGC